MSGKTIICATAALTLFTSSAFAVAPSIAKLQGARRVLIVSAPSDTDAMLQTQRRTLSSWRQSAEDRDVSEVQIVGDKVEGADETAADLRKEYDLPKIGFAVILIGKDGHVAIRSKTPIASIDLARKIDAMPMRRAGQR